MENLKPTKNTKLSTRRKPIKVVYISNPMKVNAHISDFRALVQQLTGRNSVFPDTISGVVENNPSSANISTTQKQPSKKIVSEVSVSGSGSGSGSRSDESSDWFGEVYTPDQYLLDSLPVTFSSDWGNE